MREIQFEFGLPFKQLTSWTSLDPNSLCWKTLQIMTLNMTGFYEELAKNVEWNVAT